MFLTPFSFCHFSLAVRSWTKKSVENCCSEFPASVFCSSFSIALLQRHRYYYSIALSPPTKCLPQNLPLSICSPLGKEMEEKKGTTKRTRGREGGRKRERERKASHRNVWSKPVTGKDHAFLWAGPTVTPSRQMQALSHSCAHTHTHTPLQYLLTSTIYPHMSKQIMWRLPYTFTKQTPVSARCQTRMSVLECTPLCLCPSWADLTLRPLKNSKGPAELWVTRAEERMGLEGERLELVCWPPAPATWAQQGETDWRMDGAQGINQPVT